MPKEITSILQSLAPRQKPSVSGQAAVKTTVAEKPLAPQADRVSLTESARQLQLTESAPGQATPTKSDPAHDALTYAQRPTPAMANMVASFFKTADMEGFDANSDLNADGVINFQDLAALRDIEAGAGAVPPQHPKTVLNNLTDAFLSTESSENFDAPSDLNDDGMINFQDLAIFRSKMEGN